MRATPPRRLAKRARHETRERDGDLSRRGAPSRGADPGNSGTGSQLVLFDASTPAYVVPQVEHLLGDLGGVRTDLKNRGI